ncbi:hypothetical protein BKA59DRAFT_409071, partial [Fusarium tricinctum]
RHDRKRPYQPLEGLTTYDGYICTDDKYDYYTRRVEKIHNHMPAHSKKAS